MSDYVLLGVLDARINAKNASWSTNKIGGQADWMNNWQRWPLCEKCGKSQRLIVQIYCPLEASDYHRTLYVFCCSDKHCWTSSNGWSVYRMQSKVEIQSDTIQKSENIANVWGEDDEEWGDDDDFIAREDNTEVLEPVVSDTTQQFDVLSLDERDIGGFTDDEAKNKFDSFYINVFDEPGSTHTTVNDDKYIQELIEKYKDNLEKESESYDMKIADETYEKHELKDKTFYKFWKKVNLCPDQVIRYSWKGSPLYISELNDFVVPVCDSCGEKRVFEFQLMPALIPYLKDGNTENDDVEFGAIYVYSCSKSCFKKDFPQKEQIIYCPDPDLKFFKSQKT